MARYLSWLLCLSDKSLSQKLSVSCVTFSLIINPLHANLYVPSFSIGAQGIIIVYDVTDRETFDNVRTWINEIEKYSQAGVCKILVGNKSDMSDRRQVSFEEGQEFASQFGMPFLETSAKATQNVDLAFDTMTREIKEKMMQKPGGGRGTAPGQPAFGQGKQLPAQMQTPGGEPSAQHIATVNLNKKKEKSGKGGCC